MGLMCMIKNIYTNSRGRYLRTMYLVLSDRCSVSFIHRHPPLCYQYIDFEYHLLAHGSLARFWQDESNRVLFPAAKPATNATKLILWCPRKCSGFWNSEYTHGKPYLWIYYASQCVVPNVIYVLKRTYVFTEASSNDAHIWKAVSSP